MTKKSQFLEFVFDLLPLKLFLMAEYSRDYSKPLIISDN